MSVKRYYLYEKLHELCEMREDSNGAYVAYDDYAALEANFFEVVNNNAIYVKELLKLREEAKLSAPSDAEAVKLAEALENLRQPHFQCDDCWYSCPKSEDGCCDDRATRDVCNCGADAANKIIDEALAAFREKQGRVG